MQALYNKYVKNTDNHEIITIKKFLEGEKLHTYSESQNIWSKLAEVTHDSLLSVDYAPLKIGKAVLNITKALFTPDYEEARKALFGFLDNTKKRLFVLIDSIEAYNIRDSISGAICTALIETVRQYNSNIKMQVIVKVAFPSEIYPMLQPVNREKIEGRNLFILWSFKDLFCLLSKRYFKRYGDNTYRIHYDDLNNYDKAKEYLFANFPEYVEADQGIKFNSVAYIIRHTLKKPRQIILLFNIIYTIAEDQGLLYDRLTSAFINKGVHARLDLLVEGALDIYEQVYENATSIVKRVICEMPICFGYNELMKKFSEISSLRSEANLSREEVVRLLLESCSLGVQVQGGQKLLNNVELIEGCFEYQIKGTINYSNNTQFVIHPMFYQEVRNVIDLQKYIYPIPLEDEEKVLVEKMKINLK